MKSLFDDVIGWLDRVRSRLLGIGTHARLARIEHLLQHILRVLQQQVDGIMALRGTDDEVIAEIHRTTDVAKAAALALVSRTDKVIELTAKLAEAIANSGASDDVAVKAALAELKTSNDSTVSTTAATAAAIANTDPTVPPPVIL